MQILCVTSPHPSLSHESESVGRHLRCLVLVLRVGEGMVRDRFVIKSQSGKSLFNLSSPTRIILLETGSVCNMWIVATRLTAPNSAPSRHFKPYFVLWHFVFKLQALSSDQKIGCGWMRHEIHLPAFCCLGILATLQQQQKIKAP